MEPHLDFRGPFRTPPPLRRLEAVVPVGLTEEHDGILITVFSLELYAEGLLVNLRLLVPSEHRRLLEQRRQHEEISRSIEALKDDPEAIRAYMQHRPPFASPELRLAIVDDLGRSYDTFGPEGGGGGEAWRWKFFAVPRIDPAARRLTIEIPEISWRSHAYGDSSSGTADDRDAGPWAFRVPVGPGSAMVAAGSADQGPPGRHPYEPPEAGDWIATIDLPREREADGSTTFSVRSEQYAIFSSLHELPGQTGRAGRTYRRGQSDALAFEVRRFETPELAAGVFGAEPVGSPGESDAGAVRHLDVPTLGDEAIGYAVDDLPGGIEHVSLVVRNGRDLWFGTAITSDRGLAKLVAVAEQLFGTSVPTAELTDRLPGPDLLPEGYE